MEEYGSNCITCYLIGDLNIHHARWLRFSNGNTTEGEVLKTICEENGLLHPSIHIYRKIYKKSREVQVMSIVGAIGICRKSLSASDL